MPICRSSLAGLLKRLKDPVVKPAAPVAADDGDALEEYCLRPVHDLTATYLHVDARATTTRRLSEGAIQQWWDTLPERRRNVLKLAATSRIGVDPFVAVVRDPDTSRRLEETIIQDVTDETEAEGQFNYAGLVTCLQALGNAGAATAMPTLAGLVQHRHLEVGVLPTTIAAGWDHWYPVPAASVPR